MVRPKINILLLGSILIVAPCGYAVAEEKPAIALSPELALNAPEVPDDRNGIVLFERRLDALDEKIAKSLAASLEKLRMGTPVDDPALFDQLEKRHAAARELLKAPARCPRRTDFPKVFLYSQIFQGADALACRSVLKGNRTAAISYRRDSLEWSRLIRGSHPALIEYLVALTGWTLAFNGMPRDWETHPDQGAGLAEIERLHREFPCPWNDLIPVLRSESQFWSDSGGTLGILKNLPREQSTSFLLREPFNHLTVGDLLELPFDEAIEIRRYEARQLRTIEAIRRQAPLVDWPGIRFKPTGKTLEAYRKRPNGLGELSDDYANDLHKDALAMILFQQPGIETCIAWLKEEAGGIAFTGESPGVKTDPMTGKPLRIEPESRRIRSVGLDLKFEETDDSLWMPGFVTGNDRLVQVPAWRHGD